MVACKNKDFLFGENPKFVRSYQIEITSLSIKKKNHPHVLFNNFQLSLLFCVFQPQWGDHILPERKDVIGCCPIFDMTATSFFGGFIDFLFNITSQFWVSWLKQRFCQHFLVTYNLAIEWNWVWDAKIKLTVREWRDEKWKTFSLVMIIQMFVWFFYLSSCS